MSDWQVFLQGESCEERKARRKADLPMSLSSARVLMTLAKGMALWGEQRLEPAVFVRNSCRRTPESGVFGDGGLPAQSGSRQFRIVGPARRRRAEGLGRFRALRALHNRGRSWR